MASGPVTVLFVCTGNSARSILAESILNAIDPAKYRAFSAGSRPAGRVNPLALELLAKNGCPTGALRSKSWEEFAKPGAPALDFVITVCDNAAGEACPVWPGRPVTAHWGVADPAAAQGGAEERRKAFLDAYLVLRRRIELFAGLPLGRLDEASLSSRVREIGGA